MASSHHYEVDEHLLQLDAITQHREEHRRQVKPATTPDAEHLAAHQEPRRG